MTSISGRGAVPPSRARLGSWPTPLEPAPRLAVALGLDPDDLWIKRDDLTGLGGGGNKVRKLEWTAGTALAQGADILVTTGAAQSNHARLTAAAGAKLGLEVVLVLTGSPEPLGNIALDTLLGATIHWCGDASDEELATSATDIAAALSKQGRSPAVIPFGGSNALGATGYRDAGAELLDQDPSVEHIVVALGSGGTMAGLVVALGTDRVLGIDTGAMTDPAPAVATMATELSGHRHTPDGLDIDRSFLGPGYGSVTDDVLHALRIAARTEGLILDPTYTARAMAGLIHATGTGRIQRGQRTVFWHTGGLPGLLGHPTALTKIMNQGAGSITRHHTSPGNPHANKTRSESPRRSSDRAG